MWRSLKIIQFFDLPLLLLIWRSSAIEDGTILESTPTRRLRHGFLSRLGLNRPSEPAPIEQDVSSVDIININNNNNSPKIQPRIVGGTSVNPAENRYPYFALMWGQGVCGGVLIAPSIVLTAAHCMNAAESVLVGVQSREEVWAGQYSSIQIVQKVIHPNYSTNQYAYDVMVMKLATPSDKPYVKMNADGGLLGMNLPESSGTTFNVMGFGDMDAGSVQALATQLQIVDVLHVSQTQCQTAYHNIPISEDMICAANFGKDSCGGDSGGPLILPGTSYSTDTLLGTVSWGIGCADIQFPGVYSRTSFFYGWIVEQICSLSPGNVPDYMACPTPSPTISMSPTQSPVPTMSSVPSRSPSISPRPSPPPTPKFINTLRFVSWATEERLQPLGHCEGDCDSDMDCDGDMICYYRSDGEDIPGCLRGTITGAQFLVADFCIYPWDI